MAEFVQKVVGPGCKIIVAKMAIAEVGWHACCKNTRKVASSASTGTSLPRNIRRRISWFVIHELPRRVRDFMDQGLHLEVRHGYVGFGEPDVLL